MKTFINGHGFNDGNEIKLSKQRDFYIMMHTFRKTNLLGELLAISIGICICIQTTRVQTELYTNTDKSYSWFCQCKNKLIGFLYEVF